MSTRVFCLLALLCAYAAPTPAEELEPIRRVHGLGAGDATAVVWSVETLAVGIEVDRDQSRLIAFARKNRELARPAVGPVPKRGYVDGEPVQFEVLLRGPKGVTYTERIDMGSLCLVHDAEAPPHIEGDTIRMHRDTFIVELPALSGFDTVEVAYYDGRKSAPGRRTLGSHVLDPSLLQAVTPQAESSPSGAGRYAQAPAAKAGATVRWPEAYGDSQAYRVFGSADDALNRINVTIVPDGYTYEDKAAMDEDADRLVNAFRNKSPYRELDPFINYTLVYAYSNESGTDECDCGIISDTAMGTRFPASGDSCGGSGNRCLYYGGSCDSSRTVNIVAAELRAPAHDETVIMVNTERYGGCGGARAVYSAGNTSAVEIAVHELGHSLAGLADEYGGSNACGISGGGINTSTNPTVGNWPEWVDDLGAPHEGGRYYDNCIYRPTANCEMRSLFQSFCPVCRQHWSLIVLGHPRVAPTAPIAAVTPGESSIAWQGQAVTFTVTTRLPAGGGSTIEWFVEGPDDAEPIQLLEDATTFTHTFEDLGAHRVQVVVTAATDFVKSERYGANRDTAVIEVDVAMPLKPAEVSGPGGVPLGFQDRETLFWEDATDTGVTSYNLYRGWIEGLRAGNAGACLEPELESPAASDAAQPIPGSLWIYLVTGENSLGEGSAGWGTGRSPRRLPNPCH